MLSGSRPSNPGPTLLHVRFSLTIEVAMLATEGSPLRQLLTLLAVLTPLAAAQDPVTQRLDRLEQENRDLRQRVEALGLDVERFSIRDLVPVVGESRYGLGPAASKVYAKDQGVSLGGYGEFLYQARAGQTDRFDALRNVLYVGYKFDDRFVFNSEIEFEHGTTSTGSGTTNDGGSVSVEFATIDWLQDEAFNLRAGLLLMPVGLLNELHEPTTFLSANRPRTEQRIIPTTWREPGAGAFGDLGGLAYRAYLVGGLDGEEFDAGGLRGGRQSGNRAAVDDFAGVLRLDWTGTPGLLLGGSTYYGNAGQDGVDGAGNPVPDLGTLILEAHADFRRGPWVARALFATALIEEAGAFNASTGNNLGDRLQGYYFEVGCDVLTAVSAGTTQALTPFVRYEDIDTQASLPAGFTADRSQRDEILTFGVNYKPIDQIVLKVDFDAARKSNDSFNILLGYVF